MMTHFVVPGRPKGKDRPRVSYRGGKARAYTPKATKEYEDQVRGAYQEQSHGDPMTGVISVRIIAWYPIPKSAKKAEKLRMEAGKIVPGTRPDADNIAKAILDALNGLAFADDRQVACLTVEKRYATGDGAVEVWVSTIDSEEEADG